MARLGLSPGPVKSLEPARKTCAVTVSLECSPVIRRQAAFPGYTWPPEEEGWEGWRAASARGPGFC